MAHFNNQKKTFHQKYRVFSAAFWQNNGSTFDLERSDKIVLPPSALNALTDCNASFPVLLKIQIIDSFTNKPLPSNRFSYVVDYSAPEGLIYMSSWMITKLKLDQSGQSVVELNLPTESNLKYQCPTAEFLQLQPHSLQLMLLDNITALVHKSLSDYYSSLRVNDIITVKSLQNNKEFQLTVVKISGKETAYTPPCVRLNNNINDNNLMLGFSEPKNYVLDVNEDDDNKNDAASPVEQKGNDKENNDDIEWEIVHVEKVKSISELSWKEPIDIDINHDDDKVEEKQPPKNEKKPSEEPMPEQKEEIKPPEPAIDFLSEPEPEPKREEPAPEPEREPVPVVIPEPEPVYTEWDCPKCLAKNEWAYKFCPKCGCNQNQWKPPVKEVVIVKEEKEKVIDEVDDVKEDEDNMDIGDDDVILLKKMSVINDGTYGCGEDRQTGWIVKNISGKKINVKGKLVKFAGSNDVVLKYDDIIQFDMNVNDEMFILIEVKAPQISNQYHIFCQLINDKNKKRICEVLSLPVIVKSEFGDKKEAMVKQIIEMGFNDRKKIITALKKWNWDELKAINWLATH